MAEPAFADLVRVATGGETPRVWSLLVTFFGDVVEPGGGEISGVLLQRLMGLCGVSPEATRVALHRLRKDGWIESTKVGRESRYRLSARGAAETKEASAVIYGSGPLAERAWLLIGDPAGGAVWENARSVGGALAVTGVWSGEVEAALCFPLEPPLPAWMREAVVAPELVAQSVAVHGRLVALLGAPPEGKFTPLEGTALRGLVVHGWRRLVLRAPVLPDFVLPEGWRGSDARDVFAALLERLPRYEVHRIDPD